MYMEHNMKRIDKEFNALTGEETITERDETAQEQAERETLEAEIAQRQAEATAKAVQRRAILEHLKITEEEARILLGGN
jgi:hypothetical protein